MAWGWMVSDMVDNGRVEISCSASGVCPFLCLLFQFNSQEGTTEVFRCVPLFSALAPLFSLSCREHPVPDLF